MPKISIIVPVYNTEKYIRRCLDSILNQTFKDFELILVDDGSPDNCGVICDEYAAKDSRIRVIHKKNGGVSAARNSGLDIATGKYIMFCDSDDWTEPCWLKMLYIKAEEHPNMCIVANMWSVTGEEICRPIGKIETSNITKTYYEIWENGISPYTPNKIYRRDIIESDKLRFDPSRKLSEDLEFDLKYQSIIRKNHKRDDIFIYIDTPLYFYRMNTEGATRKYRPALMGENLFPFYIRLPYIEPERMGDYCDGWLYIFIHMFNNVFDKRNKMTFMQKMSYNQKMICSEEFRYCLAHCSGKKENPQVLKVLRTHNYYLFWLFDQLVRFKTKVRRKQK